MPKKKSAFKALRKSSKQQDRNRDLRKKIKDIRKKAERAVFKKDKNTALDLYRNLQIAVDKASKIRGFMKRNTAARYKSQLAKKIKQITGSEKK